MSTDSDTPVELMETTLLAHYASEDVQAGFGALETERGNLPLEVIDLDAVVTGLAARMDLVQAFHNPFDQPLEATYIFPLPDRAAVTSLRMEADGRIVEGVLKERGQARADYDQAVTEGRRASIAEQERSGVFTMRVGNIMPGERVVVRLSLAGLLPFEDGAATFRFPLVVAPRYIPGTALPGAQVGDGVAADTDAVPDASRITPPVLLPGFPNPVRLAIRVQVNPVGESIPALKCSLHSVVTERPDTRSGRWVRVYTGAGQRIDRDFVLRIDYRAQQSVTTALTTHRDDTQEATAASTYALTLMPPTAAAGPGVPKSVILLLDRSGSMAGWKLVAARRAAARIVDSLAPHDRFAVWTFDNRIQRPDTLPQSLHPATDRDRFRAVEFLANVTDGGGTELLAPLSQAVDVLNNDELARRSPDRVVVLITDGQVGNEDQILRVLGPRLDGIRIHTVGVDRAVNEGFLNSLAALSGGRCELVESEDRLDEAMRAIHHRIATPLVTQLRIESSSLPLDPATVAPARLPDLFVGAPVVIMGRTAPGTEPTGSVTVVGKTPDGLEWRQTVTAAASDNAALPALWARMRIRDLEDRYVSGPVRADALEREIIDVSLRFNVLSRFTAFVAVDERVVNVSGVTRRIVQPVEAPQGWDMFEQQDAAIGGGVGVASMPPAPAPAYQPAPMPGRPPTPMADGMPAPSRMRAPASAPGASEPTPPRELLRRKARSVDRSTETALASPAAESAADVPVRAPEARRPIPIGQLPRPTLPDSVRTFAAQERTKLLQAAVESFRARHAALIALSAEIGRHIDRFTADGLDENLVRALRDLASDLRNADAMNPHGMNNLWVRAADMLDALSGDYEPSADRQPEHGRRGAMFWRR